jgi:hypothetical protein
MLVSIVSNFVTKYFCFLESAFFNHDDNVWGGIPNLSALVVSASWITLNFVCFCAMAKCLTANYRDENWRSGAQNNYELTQSMI